MSSFLVQYYNADIIFPKSCSTDHWNYFLRTRRRVRVVRESMPKQNSHSYRRWKSGQWVTVLADERISPKDIWHKMMKTVCRIPVYYEYETLTWKKPFRRHTGGIFLDDDRPHMKKSIAIHKTCFARESATHGLLSEGCNNTVMAPAFPIFSRQVPWKKEEPAAQCEREAISGKIIGTE